MKNLSKILFSLCLILVFCFMFSCNVKNNINSELQTEESIMDERTTYIVSDDIDVVEETNIKETETIIPMKVTNVYGYRDSDATTYIEIEFSQNIKDKFDGSPYIKIEPNILFSVSKVDNKFIVKGNFDTKQPYNVTVLKGVKSYNDVVSLYDNTTKIVFDQKKPKLLFSSDGIILPAVNDKKVYIRTLNVKKVNVLVRKVYANNITQFLHSFDFSGNGKYLGTFDDNVNDNDDYDYDYDYDYGYYSRNDVFSNIGDVLYNIDFDIDNEIDTWVQSAIDLTGVLDSNGIYFVDVKYDKNGTSYQFSGDMDEWDIGEYLLDNGYIQKTVLLTDIGIMAQKNNDGLNVNVLNIVNNETIRGAKVYLISKNNQILEEKTTNADGVVNFEDHKNSFYILVDNKNDKSILMLQNALNTNGFDIDGSFETGGINGFIYTERGVYRPGDTIYVGIIARNNNEPLETKQPIKITVYDPTAVKVVDNAIVNDGKNGFYTYNFKTDISARTGIWRLEATIGNKVFKKDISVETVVPNKIQVNIDIPEVINYDDRNIDGYINANYLFGEPAKDLEYSVNFSINEEPINFPQFKEYSFKTPSTYGFSGSKYFKGNLNANGFATIDMSSINVEFGSLNLLADVYANVKDDGGRHVNATKYIKLKKYDTYVGIENTSNYKKPGSKLDLKVICVTEDGKSLVAGKNLKYRVYGNDYYWWYDYTKYSDFIRSFKSDKHTKLIYEDTLVSKDVPTLLDYVIPNNEYIYVEIEDTVTGQIAGVNLRASEWVDASTTKRIETLNVSADKNKYNVGEVAQIKYKGVTSSKAIITIEKSGKIINQYFRDVNKSDMIENIMITKDMTPNVYVYVTLLQNYIIKENDRPFRLYGVIPINVEDEDTKMDLQLDAPDQIRPNEKFTIKIKNNKNKQVDFTVAVVDEGLLDITAYKTPSPWNYFFQKLASRLDLFDNYSEIIDRPYGDINQILKVGGDGALLDEMARRRRLKDLGLEEADRFTPVSMFKGVLTTDSNGYASVDFDMPNYMGSVRIMVVAVNNNSYGSVEKNMIVKAPLIVQPTLPRTLKIGDKISIPVSIFALEDGIRDISVYYTFKGKTQTKNLTLSKGDKDIIYFDDEVSEDDGVRSERLTIGVKSNVYNYEETVGMAINSNNPTIELSENKELKGNEVATFVQDKEYVKGTVDSVITISNHLIFGLDQRLKYLIKYPYGCAEQTTSSVFPQLFIDKLQVLNTYNKSQIVDNINAGISRLKLFQLPNGSFSYWPGAKNTSAFATNYIGHFLICAKQKGYYVPDSMFDNWINYISKQVKTMDVKYSQDIDYKCYSLYLLALAGKENVSEMNYMFEHYFNNGLSETSKMYLLAAYKLAGEDNVALTNASYINMASVRKKFKELIEQDRYYYNYSYGSELREIAIYLDCYYTIYGEIDYDAFNEILSALRTRSWYSTQTTAYCLVALSNLVEQERNKIIKGVIEVDGIKQEYSTDDCYRMTIDEKAKNIKVIPDTDGITYVNYYIEGVPVDSDITDYSDGFTISRQFYDDNGSILDVSNVKSGTSFWLEVNVFPTNKGLGQLDNIALTQVLPSGWEIENLRLNDINFPKWFTDKANVDYTDIRDDRIMWFFNYSGYRNYKFLVKINAVTKGEFDFPGTTLEAMYDNNYKAYKKGQRVKVN